MRYDFKRNVAKSFWVCRIGIRSDGSENDEIHCFRQEGQALLHQA